MGASTTFIVHVDLNKLLLKRKQITKVLDPINSG